VVRAGETIRAGVDAAAVAVDRKIESDIRRIVFRDDFARRGFLKNFDFCFWRSPKNSAEYL
jgi:hypothetical protein